MRTQLHLYLLAALGFALPLSAQPVPGPQATPPCSPCERLEKLLGEDLTAAERRSGEPPAAFWQLQPADIQEAVLLSQACLEVVRELESQESQGTPQAEPTCRQTSGAVEAVLTELDVVRSAAAGAQQYLELVSALLGEIDAIDGLPGRRAELPPPQAGQRCDELWGDLEGLASVTERLAARAGTRPAQPRGLVGAANRTREGVRELCTLSQRILTSACTARGWTYFTWTQTWRAYQSLESVLSRGSTRAVCE